MAEVIQIRNSQATVKQRSPWGWIGLTIITFGIYSLFWYYYVNREMRDFGAANGDQELAQSNPVSSILAVTIGAIIIVPWFISVYGTYKRANRTSSIAGQGEFLSPGLALVLTLFAAIVMYPLLQNKLNQVWATQV